MRHAFDAVITKIAPEQRGSHWERGQVVYAFDPRTGKAAAYSTTPILSRIGLLSRPERFQYYLLTPQPKPRPTCPAIEVVLSDTSNRRLKVEVVLVVRGTDPQAGAETVAALAREAAPFDSLKVLVESWLQNYVDDNPPGAALKSLMESTGSSTAAREACSQHLAARAKTIGLLVNCELRLPEEDLALEPLILPVTVMVSDNEEELRANLTVTIHPPESPQERDLAFHSMAPLERVKQILTSRTVQWFRTECTLQKFCFAPGEVRSGLEAHLKKYVEGELHRTLFAFHVTCTPPFSTEIEIREDYEVLCKLERAEIAIQHKVLLERSDIAHFRRARIANLESWMEKTLARHTRAVIFGKEFGDVVVGFPDLKKTIRERIAKDVSDIGFAVTQLITISTDEKIRQVLDGVVAFDTKELIFKTRDPRVEFRLSIQARVTFEKNEGIRKVLSPDEPLSEIFARTAREEAARVIRELSPEELHLNFTGQLASQQAAEQNTPPDATRKPPEALIREAIDQRFAKLFDAKTEYMTLTQEPTELVRLYSALRPPENYTLDVPVAGRGKLAEEFVYHLEYRITDIAGWSSFEDNYRNTGAQDVPGKADEIATAIRKFLLESARALLEALPPSKLRSLQGESGTGTIAKMALGEALKTVRSTFGLNVDIVTSRREQSPYEKWLTNSDQQTYVTLRQQREALRQDFFEKLAVHPLDSLPIAEIQKKIEFCDEKLKEFETAHDERFKALERMYPDRDVAVAYLTDQTKKD